ncbi:hypothetical protein ACDY96_20320 [Rhizobium mongolense]|uniref:hypothetical protein n=1 Tax=Rhizobium TaxID=379 RepID=UPI0024B225AF|nr:hypothetical protein [Rhizobium sp. CC1099]WFU85847.1 hypothetical protein QA644_11730 [Rhizobium sp. CC1099]
MSRTDPDSGSMVRDGKPKGFFYLDHLWNSAPLPQHLISRFSGAPVTDRCRGNASKPAHR